MLSPAECFQKAAVLLTQGRIREAADLLKAGLQSDPENEWAWMNLGVAEKDLGDHDHAEECLRIALDLKDDYGDAWFNLGSLYLRDLEDADQAWQCLQEAMRCNPADEDAVSFAAEALVKLGRLSEAESLLDEALGRHPDWLNVRHTQMTLAAQFRIQLSKIAGTPKFKPVRKVDRVIVQFVPDIEMPFRFNDGSRHVVSINLRVPAYEAIEKILVQELSTSAVLDNVVFEMFVGERESLEIEIGSRVPLKIAQGVVRACFDSIGGSFAVSIEREDRAFGYTQRAYIGSLGKVHGKRVTRELFKQLMSVRDSREFHTLVEE